MACSVEDHKAKAYEKIGEVFNNTDTIKSVGLNVTITPSNKSAKIRDKATAIRVAQNGLERIQNWAAKEYGNKFKYGWGVIYTGNANYVKVAMQFPKKLEEALFFKIDAENRQQGEDENNLGETVNDPYSKRINNLDEKVGELTKEIGRIRNQIGKEFNLNNLYLNTEIDLGVGVMTEDIARDLINNLEWQIKDILDERQNNVVSDKYLDNSGKNNANTTTSILNNIILNSKEGDEYHKLATFLLSIQDKNKTVKIKVSKSLETEGKNFGVIKEENVDAYYNSGENTIYMSYENIDKSTEERFKNVFLHELLHSYTVHPFYKDREKLNDEEARFVSDIEKLLKVAKKYSKNPDMYGYSNPKEFISEIMSDKAFREEIKSLKLNIWDRIISAIRKFLEGKTILEKSESVIYEYLESIETVRINANLMKEDRKVNDNQSKETESVKDLSKHSHEAFAKEINVIKNKIMLLGKKRDKEVRGSDKYKAESERIEALKLRLSKAIKSFDEEEFAKFADELFSNADHYISRAENNQELTRDELLYIQDIIKGFRPSGDNVSGNPDTQKRANALFKRFMPIAEAHSLKIGNEFRPKNKQYTKEMVDAEGKDITTWRKNTGSLSDVSNFIASTIGLLINRAKNKASTKNQMFKIEVQKHVDALISYSKNNGKTLESVYDLFCYETDKGDLILTPANIYKNGKSIPNPAFDEIKKSAELLDFYKFYQTSIVAAEANLPYKIGKFHIPNIKKTSIKSQLRDFVTIKGSEVIYDKDIKDKGIDVVPYRFRDKLSAKDKSRDLGASLLDFVAYTNEYNELQDVLPEARLLQEQLLYKVSDFAKDPIKKRKFLSSDKTNELIEPENTNLYQMVSKVIDMQILGEMSLKQGSIKGKSIKDAEGNIVGHKEYYWSDIADLGIKYNSLLRIGLSPLTALTNVVYGDLSNIIEATGGESYGLKDLAIATKLFYKDVYSLEGSNLEKYLSKLNPLQELEDYNISEGVKLKKMSVDKAQELMYSMQKRGELFLQSRTMLAMMLNKGLIDSNGELTKEGELLLSNDEKVADLSNEVQRVNQMIHGRYTRREAGTAMQSAWWRIGMQFRKWIPSAIETRFDKKHFDPRLKREVEGRYVTVAELMFTKDVLDNLQKMAKGELTPLQMANMKKTLTEAVLFMSVILLTMALKGGDDDKERRKKAHIKLSLTILERVAGDILFMYNPESATKIGQNIAPLAKTADDLLKVIWDFTSITERYERGRHKGDLKIGVDFWKVMPFARPFQDVIKILDEYPIELH